MGNGSERLSVSQLAARLRERWGDAAPNQKAIRLRIRNGSIHAIDTNPGGRRAKYLIAMSEVERVERNET